MDDYRYLQPNNAARRARHCHGSMSYDALGDTRQPGSRADLLTSGFDITRRGRSGDRAATRAAGEEGCRVQAFADADAAPRALHCARIITSYHKVEDAAPSSHRDSHRPHCKSVTVAQLPGQRVHGSSPHCTRRVSGLDFDTIHANFCTQVTNGDSLEVDGAAGSGMSRFK